MSALTDAARAEAERRAPTDGHVTPARVKEHTALATVFIAGAQWQAEQEPTDGAVLAALEAYDAFNVRTWGGGAAITPRESLADHQPLPVDRMREVLTAALRAAYTTGGAA